MTNGRPPAAALDDDAFAPLMAVLGPFETRPEIAVAVSGGADSLCLALLAGRWARRRGGRAVALVVDHGLRPEAAAEAAATRDRLAGLGIEARILVWRGDKPTRAIQAAARRARYDRLLGHCREFGLLHLLLAHHAGDQAETVLMRRRRGSGEDGLAGMAAVVEREGVRLLRPLLRVDGARLRATLAAAGQTWIEDPSNRDPAFTRVRARAEIAADGSAPALCEQARRSGLRRAERDAETAALLARLARLSPAGDAVLERAALLAAGPEPARRALERVLICVGGAAYPPRRGRLARLLAALDQPGAGGSTLGGCRILPLAGDRLLVCREAAAMTPEMAVTAGQTVAWDGRFRVRVEAPAGAGRLSLRPLDAGAWSAFGEAAAPALAALPAAVRAGLPALWTLDDPLALPHLNKWRWASPSPATAWLAVCFRPRGALAAAPFAVAEG